MGTFDKCNDWNAAFCVLFVLTFTVCTDQIYIHYTCNYKLKHIGMVYNTTIASHVSGTPALELLATYSSDQFWQKAKRKNWHKCKIYEICIWCKAHVSKCVHMDKFANVIFFLQILHMYTKAFHVYRYSSATRVVSQSVIYKVSCRQLFSKKKHYIR